MLINERIQTAQIAYHQNNLSGFQIIFSRDIISLLGGLYIMEASKSEIKSIQGLSVLAMLCLHLFCRYDFSNLYTPTFYLFGYPICFYFAQISDFCVMGFAFCSGYAHYFLFETDQFYFYNRIKSLLKLIVNFWIVLILFTLNH